MFAARRAISTSTICRADLIQQAFLNKAKEYGRVGGELSKKDPVVKKILQDELNRVATKYNLSADTASTLPLNFQTAKVASSVTAALEEESFTKLVEGLKVEEEAFLAAQEYGYS